MYTLFVEKNVFVWEKSFMMKKIFTEKNFFKEKNINENVKNTYPISKIQFYTENVCVTNKISFLNIYSFCKKNFLIIKNIFVKTSL